MTYLVATRNQNKLREIQQILGPGGSLRSLDDLGIPPSAEEDELEDGDSFQHNARAKALHFARISGMPAIADDSGLVVHALDGAPGVHSKRFSGRHDLSGKALDMANNETLLERLRDVPDELRTAHFVCAVCIAWPDGRVAHTMGTCTGTITHEPRGDHGFGYDPLFQMVDLGVTFAQLAPEQKHERSHRARAFRALAAFLAASANRP